MSYHILSALKTSAAAPATGHVCMHVCNKCRGAFMYVCMYVTSAAAPATGLGGHFRFLMGATVTAARHACIHTCGYFRLLSLSLWHSS
jgi:hypothetical protein